MTTTRTVPLPNRDTITATAIYTAVALAIMTVAVWAPLRFAYPALLDNGVTTPGVNAVLWLALGMTTIAALGTGTALSIRRRATHLSPLVGCAVAAVAFTVATTVLPIW